MTSTAAASSSRRRRGRTTNEQHHDRTSLAILATTYDELGKVTNSVDEQRKQHDHNTKRLKVLEQERCALENQLHTIEEHLPDEEARLNELSARYKHARVAFLEEMKDKHATCSICMEAPSNAFLPCGHVYCVNCLVRQIRLNMVSCAICQRQFAKPCEPAQAQANIQFLRLGQGTAPEALFPLPFLFNLSEEADY